MHRADLVNLPRRRRCPQAWCIPDIAAPASRRIANTARVTFANGAVAEADIVVGCDGIHSELRPFVFPPSQPVFSGTVAYRGLVPHTPVPDWPTDAWQMWLGRGKHFLVFPVRARRRLINFVGFVPADAGDEGILDRQGRSRCAARRIRRLGSAHRSDCWARSSRPSDRRCTIATRCRPGPRDG